MGQGGCRGGAQLFVPTVPSHREPRAGDRRGQCAGVFVAPWPCQMACAPSSAQHWVGPMLLTSTAGAWQMQSPSLDIAFVSNSRLTRGVTQGDCFLCKIWFSVALILASQKV